MAATRALAATGEQITNTENYVSSALTVDVQAYLPVVNAGATTTVPVGRVIEVESTGGRSIELLTEKGKRVGIVPRYSSALVVARSGLAQSEDSAWLFIPQPGMDARIRQADITIPSAEVLALNATPKVIVAAPGANKAIIFEGAVVTLTAGTAYAGIAAGEDLAFAYTNLAGLQVAAVETTGFLDQATAQVRFARPQGAALGAGTISSFTPVANAALVAGLLTGEITTGTGDIKVRVFYRVVPTVL